MVTGAGAVDPGWSPPDPGVARHGATVDHNGVTALPRPARRRAIARANRPDTTRPDPTRSGPTQPDPARPDPGRSTPHRPLLRATVLLAGVLAACLLGTGVAAAAPAAGPGAAPPCPPSVRACVRLSTNQAWLLRDGKVVLGPVRVSHGRPGYRTPPGTFRVSYKDRDHRSSLFDGAPMPYSVFFNRDIAFHQGSVREKSHGCVHLPAAAARTFFTGLKGGDVVQVVR